jgi:hypothetical protein
MSVGELSRKERVLSVLAAARRLADPNDPLGKEARHALPEATGLSKEGVELGFRHLETSASEGDLQRLILRAGSAPRVHVVLSANVFVGVVRAVALAVAAAPRVIVRASSRESVMSPLLRRALDEGGSGVGFDMAAELEAQAGDEIHVYGRNETIASIAQASPPGVRLRGHGPGFGVALVEPRAADLDLSASRLSWDTIAFDQRGCLSPKLAFLEGSLEDADAFASKLAAELEKREAEVPRGVLGDDERREQALYRQTLHAVGRCHAGASFTVGCDVSPRGLTLPPAGRNVHVVRIAGQDQLLKLVDALAGAITCVGHAPSSPLAHALLACARGARSLPLGSMQDPPLDGPVDLREMV